MGSTSYQAPVIASITSGMQSRTGRMHVARSAVSHSPFIRLRTVP
jgi:hypothetical protein